MGIARPIAWCVRTTATAALVVVTAGCGPPSTWRGVTPDHRLRFEVADRDGLSCFTLGARDPECFDGISVRDIVFSPDSRRWAYPALDGDAWRVIADGEPGPSVQGIGEIQFSPDGSRLAYSALRAGKWHVVVDGRFGEAFDSLYRGTIRFDPPGRRVAYGATRNARATVVLDGRIQRAHDGIGAIQFGPFGRRIGYIARDAGRALLIVDGVVTASADALTDFRFSPSGVDVAFAFAASGETWVESKGGTQGPYSAVRSLTYRAESGPAFIARTDTTEYVMFAGRASPAFQSVDAPSFNSGASRWGFIGHDSAESVVRIDGHEIAREEWAVDLRLSADGTRHAYVAQRGALMYVVHESGESGYEVVVPGTLIFTEYGNRWACLAGDLDDEELYVVVEGIERTRPFDWSAIGEMMSESYGTTPDPRVEQSLRAWIRAEVTLMMEEEGLSGTR